MLSSNNKLLGKMKKYSTSKVLVALVLLLELFTRILDNNVYYIKKIHFRQPGGSNRHRYKTTLR